MSVDKMHEEKLENRGGSEQLEAGFVGEGSEKFARRIVFKMDVRYVLESRIPTIRGQLFVF